MSGTDFSLARLEDGGLGMRGEFRRVERTDFRESGRILAAVDRAERVFQDVFALRQPVEEEFFRRITRRRVIPNSVVPTVARTRSLFDHPVPYGYMHEESLLPPAHN